MIGRQLELAHDCVCAGDDAAGHVARLELRQDVPIDDVIGEPVGDDRFEPVAHLDAHLVLGGRNEEDNAVVLLLASEVPVAPELIAVIGDLVALQRVQRDDDELVTGGVLQPLQLLLERDFRRRRNDPGLVDHPAGELRKGRRSEGGDECQEECRERRGEDGHQGGCGTHRCRAAPSASPIVMAGLVPSIHGLFSS